MAQQFQFRGGAAALWAEVNPVLADREMGIETDTRKFKIGDGVTHWNNLSYATQGNSGTIEIGTIETVDSGTPASVVNVGTPTAAKLNFKIPKGDIGVTGFTGQAFSGDFHDQLTAGYYYTAMAGQENAPNSTEKFILIIATAENTDYVTYEAIGLVSGKHYINVKKEGTWSGWLLLITTKDMDEHNTDTGAHTDIRAALKKAGGVPIGTITARLSKKPEAGELALDTGALVSRATYPDLWAWVQANAPLLSETDWQTQAATQTSVGAYSMGDGSTTFRLPRLLDYFRGGAAADVGMWQGDAIRNIKGFTGYSVGNSQADLTGPFTAESGSGLGCVSTQPTKLIFDASKAVPTAEENRPKTIKVLYCVKAFDAETNPGLVDLTALANDVKDVKTNLDLCATKALLGPSGWWKDPHTGMILQWGTVAKPASNLSITFPISFPTLCMSVQGTQKDYKWYYPVSIYSLTNTGFVLSDDSQARNIMWLAIGY